MFASNTGVDEKADTYSSDENEPLARVAIPAITVEHLDEAGQAAKAGESSLVALSSRFSC